MRSKLTRRLHDSGHAAAGAVRPWARRGTGASKRLLTRTARESVQDRIHGRAAEASFWTMLSLPPLLLAVLALTGQLGALLGTDLADRVATAILGWADGIFTAQTMRQVIRPLILSTLHEGHSGLLSFGLLLALWSGSAALSNYVAAITTAYDMDGLRSFWRTRILSLGLYLGALAVGSVLLPLMVLGPGLVADLLSRLPGPDLTALVDAAYWPVVCVLSLVTLTTLYHVAVPVRTRWRRDIPGAVLALAVWIGGSVALRTYLASGLRDTGPAAAPIAVLLFLYLTAIAVLLGAELNASVDDLWPDATTQHGRRQARRRRGDHEDDASAPPATVQPAVRRGAGGRGTENPEF
jgi:membrane protein